MDWSKSVCESPKWLIPTVVICSWFCWLMVHCLSLTPSFTLAACWIIEPWYHCFRRNPCYPRWRHCHQSAPQFWLCTCGTGWTYRLFKEQTRIILGDLVQVNLQNRGTPVTTMGCTISLCLCFFLTKQSWFLPDMPRVLHCAPLIASIAWFRSPSFAGKLPLFAWLKWNIPHFQTYPSLISACCPPLFLHLSSWLKLTAEPDQRLPFPQGFASHLVGDLVHLWNKIYKWTTHPVGHVRKKKNT